MAECYRHRGRETGVACARCERPICPDCMTYTPVGVRCPECARPRSRVHAPGFTLPRSPNATYALIGANLVVFAVTNRLGGGGFLGGGNLNQLGVDLALSRSGIAAGQDYRLITAAFVHFGIFHIAFNMYALYLLGGAVERYAGMARFLAIYVVSALCGSFGALLFTPNGLTAGASGAIFGLMGALFVLERQRGMSLLGGPIAGLIVLNLAITFTIPGISVGGHVGGLAGGIACGLLLSRFGRGHLAYSPLTPVTLAGIAAVGVAAVAGSLVVSG